MLCQNLGLELNVRSDLKNSGGNAYLKRIFVRTSAAMRGAE